MAQLLAGGFIALGLFVIASAIFLAREKKTSVLSTTTTPKLNPQTTSVPPEPQITAAPVPQQSEAKEVAVTESKPQITVAPAPQQSKTKEVVVTDNMLPISEPAKPRLLVHAGEHSSAWWQEQLSSLTAQLQYLREHAKDVERQIAILSEIAALSAELEMLQRKREISPDGRIALFPLQVRRQPTDMSYMTDKRPAVRKYTIEAMA